MHILIASLLLFVILSPASAQNSVGKVIIASGTATATQPGKPKRELQRGSQILEGDSLNTGKNSQAQIRFIDGSLLSLRPDTTFQVDSYQYQKGGSTGEFTSSLLKGGLRILTGTIGKISPQNYQVTTPVATIGIRGTLFDLRMLPIGLFAGVDIGDICIGSSKGGLCVGMTQVFRYAFVGKGKHGPQGLKEKPAALQNGEIIIPALPAKLLSIKSEILFPGTGLQSSIQNGVVNPNLPGLGMLIPALNLLDKRLVNGEVFNRFGLMARHGEVLSLLATGLSGQTPVFASPTPDPIVGPDYVIKLGGAAQTQLTTLTNTIDYGIWNTAAPNGFAQLLPNPLNASEIVNVAGDPNIFWVTGVPTSMAEIAGLSGVIRGYTQDIARVGSGSFNGAAISLTSAFYSDGIFIDFSNASVSIPSGIQFTDNLGGQWNTADVNGLNHPGAIPLVNGKFSYQFNDGQFIQNGVVTGVLQGSVTAGLVNRNQPADTVIGGFSLQQVNNLNNHLEGAFVVGN